MKYVVKVAWLLLVMLACSAVARASISVSLTPASVHVQANGQVQFTAVVSGTSNNVVIWGLSGTSCSGTACGQITSGGLYLAPATAPQSNVITVTATSLADLSASASASVILGATSDVTVSVSPTKTTVLEGQQQRFLAYVGGTTITSVTWHLTGAACDTSDCGSLSRDGLYTAPLSVPSPAQVTVTATSVADPASSGSAVVTIAPPVAVKVSPSTSQVNAGLHQQFSATVSGGVNTAVTWSLAGSGCTGTACGTITTTGLYTAPAVVPSPAQVSVTATSVADSTKSSTASVTVLPPVSVSISPTSTQVLTNGHQQFTATVANIANTSVKWSLAGSGCTGAACGTITSAGLYTAPAVVPSPSQVSVTATSVADPTKSSTASVTVILPVAVSISPTSAQVLTNGHRQFTATVLNTKNTSVTWSVAGSGCTGATCGTITTTGLYTAPSTVPSPAQVSVTATSEADPTKSGTASVTVIPPVAVSISPSSAEVLTNGHQQFTATVLNAANPAVTWKVAGSGCTGALCGTITTTGLYTAPATPPSPAQVSVTATSVADPTKSSVASVTITGPVVLSVSPTAAQVVTGASKQFNAKVSGTSDASVSWSVAGSGCTGASCGSISSTGLYTAPGVLPSPAQVFVTATSNADPTKSSTATVTIVPPVAVTLSPLTATVIVKGNQQFSATVSGASNASVSWKVSGSGCTATACGVVSNSGLYTAPAVVPSPAQVSVTVTSVADPTKSKSAVVTIIPPVVVSVSPSTVDLIVGEHQQFGATVSGATNSSVVWSIKGQGCSGLTCGTITASGLYGAPGVVPTPPEVSVTATSAADASKSGSATVTILPPIAVTLSPSSAQVVSGGNQQFNASVTGTTNTSVSWTLSGAGCSGSACGTLSSSGLFTAPVKVPNPAQVAVKATSLADNTKSASALVTIIPPVNVTISPTSAVVAVGGQQQFRASVVGSSNTAIDWSLSGSTCTGASCGTISTAGLFTAPSAVPSNGTVVITATPQVDVARSVSAIVTLVANGDSKLNGPYAFQFTGLDASGAFEAVGSFTADGTGKITAGTEDLNRTAGALTNIALSGTYEVSGDNRGSLTLSSSIGTQVFKFALSQKGTNGRLIEFDDSGIRGSGVFEQRDSAAFAASVLKGPYVLALSGKDSAGKHIGALAILYFNGAGSIVGGSMDVNDGGNILPTFGSVQGIYRVDTNGRSLVNLSIPGFAGGTFEFMMYVVSASKLMLVSMDPLSARNPIFGGIAELQSGAPYLTSSFKGATVFSLSGESNSVPQVIVGQLTFDGTEQPLVEFDQNVGGTVSTGNVLTGAYSIGLNGAGTLNLDNSNGASRVWEIYAISPNHAYMLDASTSAAATGELKPQSAASPFTSTNVVGTYLIGSGEPLVYGATLYSGVANFDGVKTVSGVEDIRFNSALSAGQTAKGTYTVSRAANNGRGTLNWLTPNGSMIALWIVSSSEVLGVQTDSGNSLPVVLHFEQ